jgi:DNA-binding transcriptional MerR regulator
MVGVSVTDEAVDISAMMSALGDLGVPPPKLYRIGEVVQYSGFSRQTVHNYTAMGLIHESQWTQTGHRLYDPAVFRYLALIKQLRTRFSLAQIKQLLDQSPVS